MTEIDGRVWLQKEWSICINGNVREGTSMPPLVIPGMVIDGIIHLPYCCVVRAIAMVL